MIPFRLASTSLVSQNLGSSRLALRASARTRGIQTSSSESGFRGGVASHLAAAGLGAASVMAGAYAYYHYSGIKAIVDRARAAKAHYNNVRSAWSENRPKTPSEAAAFLRRISRSRSGPVPDSFVDMVAQFQGSHEEDIDRIVFGAVDDIQAIIAESRAAAAVDGVEAVGEEGLTAQDRVSIASVVQKRARELREYIRERGLEDGKPSRGAVARFRAKHQWGAQPAADSEDTK